MNTDTDNYWRVEIIASDIDREIIEGILRNTYGDLIPLNWKKVRALSPNVGGKDRKQQYRGNETLRRLAEVYGVSHGTISKVQRIFANAPELREPMRDGTLTIEDAIRQLKSEGRWKTIHELKKRTDTSEPRV